MQPLLRFGTFGLALLASFGAPVARADQSLDEPAPFGVIQFSPGEAWIDLPYALGDSWGATLSVLGELKYPVRLDATYMATNGQIRVEDLWIAVEPHGSPAASYTRIRIALDAQQGEYSQVRAEVILDAVATRLAPAPKPAPAPSPAQTPVQTGIEYAEQPVDPGVQDVYTGGDISAISYDYATPGEPVYNIYNTYNNYDSYGSYPTPYYTNYSYYAPFCNYSPYWSAYNVHYPYGGWYGGDFASPLYPSWGYPSNYHYWNSPGWGFNYGCNPWWNSGFAYGWGNYYASFGYPWGYWGGGLVVVFDDDDCDDYDNDDCDNDNNDDDDDYAYGDDVVDSGDGDKPGQDTLGLNPRADGLHTGDSAKPVAGGSTNGAGASTGDTASTSASGNGGRTSSASPDGATLVDAGDGDPIGRTPGAGDSRTPSLPTRDAGSTPSPRAGGFPHITVTNRERNDSATRFDPRTTVTRTVDTRTVASSGAGGRDAGAPTSAPTSSRPRITTTPSSSLPPLVATNSPTTSSSPKSGKVVRLSSPSFRPGFAGVTPGASRPVATVGGTTIAAPAPYAGSRGGSSVPYVGAPTPVVNRAPGSPAPGLVVSSPGTVSIPIAPRSPGPVSVPSSRSSGPTYAPPTVSTPHVSAPAPAFRAPSVSAPAPRPPSSPSPSPMPTFKGSGGHASSGSFGGSSGGSSGPSSGGASSGGKSSGSSAGSSAGSSSSKGGRGRP